MKTNKIDSIIESINQIKQAEAPSFFETRLKAKMQIEPEKSYSYIFSFRKPAYIMSALLILLCMNIYLLNNRPIEKNISKMEHHQSTTIDAFSSDYQLINNSTY